MIETLKAFGLTEKSAHIYVATLSLGTAGVLAIAQKANLKRPTVYVRLEELIQNGYIQKITIGKKEYYRAISPQALEEKLEQNLKSLKKELPDLQFIHEHAQGKPAVTIYEGEKGLNVVYEEMAKAKELLFWSDLFAVEKFFPNAVLKINKTSVENKIFVREIIADTQDARQSSKRWAATAGDLYASRLASGPIFNDSAIYNDVVAYFRLQQHSLYVVRIEDPTIAATMKTLFDMAWWSAKPFLPKK